MDVSAEQPFAQVYCPECGASLRARRHFNNFELVELIGEGGMGSVYKAFDRSLERMVALKILRPECSANAQERARLEQEARAAASVNHPHVVKVYSFGEAQGLFYLAMELVEKGSLDDLMSIQTQVSEVQVLEIGLQIAQGLEAALEQGLIHRDVKPGNILFADAHVTKIVDFGLARVMAEEAEASGEIWGTPYYIAPERLNYEPEDFRSDIYSLGGTLFHAIAGRPPYEAKSASLVVLKQLKSQPVSLEAFAPEVASETAYVINRMLAKSPAERYQSYAELIEHLAFARAKLLERVASGRVHEREVVQVESQRNTLLITLISLAAGLLLLGGVLFLWLRSDQSAGVVAAVQGMAPTSADRIAEAVHLAAAGKFEPSGRILRELQVNAELKPPLPEWVLLNSALVSILAGDASAANETLLRLGSRDLFSAAPQDRALANLFPDVSTLAQRGTAPTRADLQAFQPQGVEGLMYFFGGVLAWQAGAWAEARGLFGTFLGIPTQPSVPWWGDYRTIASRLSGDAAAVEELSRAADAPEASRRPGLPAEIRQARQGLFAPGRAAAALEELARRAGGSLEPAQGTQRPFSEDNTGTRPLE